MKKFFVFIGSILISNLMIAQTSVVQDSKGEAGLALGDAGVVAINAKDESISFSYGIPVFYDSSKLKGPFHYIGMTAKAKGKNGLNTILKNDQFQYDGSIGIFYFADKIIDNNRTIQWHLSGDYLFNQFKLYDSSSQLAFSKQVYDNNQAGYKITSGLNFYSRLGRNWTKPIPLVTGLSINGGHKNNTGDLKSQEVSSFFTYYDPSTQQERIVQKDKSTVYAISEYKPSVGYFNVNFDVGGRPLSQIMPMVHLRWSMQEGRKAQFNPAAGIYIAKSSSPLDIVAGIQVQVSDWSNTAESIKTRKERTVVNIVAGFSF